MHVSLPHIHTCIHTMQYKHHLPTKVPKENPPPAGETGTGAGVVLEPLVGPAVVGTGLGDSDVVGSGVVGFVGVGVGGTVVGFGVGGTEVVGLLVVALVGGGKVVGAGFGAGSAVVVSSPSVEDAGSGESVGVGS